MVIHVNPVNKDFMLFCTPHVRSRGPASSVEQMSNIRKSVETAPNH
jgi:hypothetical protein